MHVTSSQRSLQQLAGSLSRSIASGCILFFLGWSPAGSPRKFRDRKLHRWPASKADEGPRRFEMSVRSLFLKLQTQSKARCTCTSSRTLTQQLRERSIASSQASVCVNGRPTAACGAPRRPRGSCRRVRILHRSEFLKNSSDCMG